MARKITWRVPPVDDGQIRIPNKTPDLIPIPDNVYDIPGAIIESERRRGEQPSQIPPGMDIVQIPTEAPDIQPPGKPEPDSTTWRMRTDAPGAEKDNGKELKR